MLIGKNLSLKLPTIEDAQLLADWQSDPEVLGDSNDVWPHTRETVEQRMKKQEHNRKEWGNFLICSLDKDERMGMIGYFNPFTLKEFFQGLEIYYTVHPDFRNKGIATQASCILINHLFNAVAVERIQATAVVDNTASCRVLEKAGMQKEGTYRRVSFLHGRYVDLHLYSIVREDWKDERSYRKSRPDF
jgi:ribosomal-protein-alanine N-acetyltransferase